MRWGQKRTPLSSTVKWATQRPNPNSLSRGLRSLLCYQTASLTVCLVRLFFNSKVTTSNPLMKSPMSNANYTSSRM